MREGNSTDAIATEHLRKRKTWFTLVFVAEPKSSYLPSQKKTRELSLNTGAIVLKLVKRLETVEVVLNDALPRLLELEAGVAPGLKQSEAQGAAIDSLGDDVRTIDAAIGVHRDRLDVHAADLGHHRRILHNVEFDSLRQREFLNADARVLDAGLGGRLRWLLRGR